MWLAPIPNPPGVGLIDQGNMCHFDLEPSRLGDLKSLTAKPSNVAKTTVVRGSK